MKKTILRKYAQLIARRGVNIDKGQEVVIVAELDQPEFVKMVVEECYRAKAARVLVEWSYLPLTKLNVNHMNAKMLGTVEAFEEEKLKYRLEKNPAMLYLASEDPDGLKGINQAKNSKVSQARYKVIKPYRDAMENKYQWCIAAIPGEKWAKKMFPELSKRQAMEKLWEAILFTSRVTEDPIKAWQEHNADLQARCDYLNSLGIESLHYTADNGTDLTVGMIPEGSDAYIEASRTYEEVVSEEDLKNNEEPILCFKFQDYDAYGFDIWTEDGLPCFFFCIDVKSKGVSKLLTVLVTAQDNDKLEDMMDFVEEYLEVD